MDDAEKAKELLLISSKEDEIVYNIKSEISNLRFAKNSKITKVEIKNIIRSVMTHYERTGDVKHFLVTTDGDTQFNIDMTMGNNEYFLTLSIKNEE